jgi:hypothetical protein
MTHVTLPADSGLAPPPELFADGDPRILLGVFAVLVVLGMADAVRFSARGRDPLALS